MVLADKSGFDFVVEMKDQEQKLLLPKYINERLLFMAQGVLDLVGAQHVASLFQGHDCCFVVYYADFDEVGVFALQVVTFKLVLGLLQDYLSVHERCGVVELSGVFELFQHFLAEFDRYVMPVLPQQV